MSVFVNRTLNMRKIKAIGFDMDYTLVRYHTEAFEKLTHKSILKKLVDLKGYPAEIKKLEFDFQRAIQGLVLDKKLGNILKLSRFGKVKSCYHGTKRIDFKTQQEAYSTQEIDLNDEHIQSLDTSFSISHGIVFGQLIDLKDEGMDLPRYEIIEEDIRHCLDLSHADGTLKNEVAKNIEKFIIKDPKLPKFLETYKEAGKKLIIITNSDYRYTKLLMDYAFNPFLEKHKNWRELFDVTITLSAKPRFFTGNTSFLSVNPKTGLMSNTDERITKGVFQGGNAEKLERDLKLKSDEVLYLGDHIYGDVVSLKKTFHWRTALVFSPIEEEIASIKKVKHIQERIDENMFKKRALEEQINNIYTKKHEENQKLDRKLLNALYEEIENLNNSISKDIDEYQKHFNPYWGEIMRSGQEESQLAGQIEKYACIYMGKVADLMERSPREYYRPYKRILPHEYTDSIN